MEKVLHYVVVEQGIARVVPFDVLEKIEMIKNLVLEHSYKRLN